VSQRPTSRKFRQDIGRLLWYKREVNGLTRREMAERIGVQPQSIRDFELGLKAPAIRSLMAYIREFGVTTTELLEANRE
jgi:transcriptional regulator with XRE-family HTH domain